MSVGRLAVLCLAAAVAACGCARAPAPGEPIDRDEAVRLARVLSAPGGELAGLRGSGSGEVTVSGRGVAVSFAFVYSRPGWLRVDLRPELGGAGHAFSSLSVLEGHCLRTYFPAKAAVVHGCLSDFIDPVPDADLGALAVGVPQLAFVADLVSPRLARDGDRLVLSGALHARRVTLEAQGSPPSLSRVEIELEPGGRTLSVAYAGHGWHKIAALPRVIELRVTGGRRPVRLSLELKKAREVDHVVREDYALAVPSGARSFTWSELNVGEEP